ncbi:carboxyvinyl-carboxyphosphonate phosphorylmutase [Planotetraspora thailandica]|uniref:Carboxyvinyl-carboxyphosphonate phosphorylmutase n=1 Tax=Planotetraspora thailandica TaxID=487172 RepID=A0A8J3UV19_9ACTN|nr:isocitrate lyase/phosphoenolpyruvate mutase family protein [Planotetraspora thailandica]GII52509.1 carboxyvinyl-carboxyphosphonate phosphorylmutase [Planotetraspora thailandica]
MNQMEKAALLRALHVPGEPLVLPNVWDAASAQVVESAGFPVIATGSAAIARVLGYSDGEGTPVAEMMAAIKRIAASVGVPVTADVERGYGLAPADLAERLSEAGAVGCNIEDTDSAAGAMVDPAEQAGFIAALRAADADLVINARVDSFLHGSPTPEEQLADAVERGRLYRDAGADCVYPIFVSDRDAIGTLVKELGGPVNVLFRPGVAGIAELAALGVARVSYGHGLHAAAQEFTTRMVAAIRAGESPYPPPQD